MSSMPETERGYAPPIVRQFSVFLDNRVGKLLELLEVMENASDVHVRAICVLDSSDHAVVRVVCGNADGARFALRQNGFTFSETDILVFEVPDESTLREACRSLLAAEVNIRFTYPITRAGDAEPAVAISVDDHTFAGQILVRKGFTLLGEFDLS